MQAKIVVRDRPCRCGCHGSDPWHRRAYVLEVIEFVAVDPTGNHGDTAQPTINGRGVARFPWGLTAVVREVCSYGGRVLTVPTWRLEVR